jgi:ATP-dependent HslUV protease ATP-binding subunit HslU
MSVAKSIRSSSDLVEISVKMTREEEIAKVRTAPPTPPRSGCSTFCCLARRPGSSTETAQPRDNDTRQRFRKMLRERRARRPRDRDRGARLAGRGGDHGAPRHGGNEQQLQGMFQSLGGGKHPFAQAQGQGSPEASGRGGSGKLVNEEELKVRASENAEQNGIVFIDEIDKIARRQETVPAPTCRAKACSATCCRWSRAAPSTPSTAR